MLKTGNISEITATGQYSLQIGVHVAYFKIGMPV